MTFPKFMLTPAAAGAALVLSSAQTAQADFSGAYAPANWTFLNIPVSPPNLGDGSFSNDGTTLTLISSDNGWGGESDYIITAFASGTWSFDWSYDSADTGNFDTGGYLLNGAYTQLAENGPGSQGPIGGSISLSVIVGDVIGFRAHSNDGVFGPGTLAITNFVGPIPAPGALALLGLAGLRGSRRRRV